MEPQNNNMGMPGSNPIMPTPPQTSPQIPPQTPPPTPPPVPAPSPAPTPAARPEKKVGPIVATLVIVLIIIIAGLYLFASRINQSDDGGAPATLSAESDSTGVEDLDAALEDATAGLDAENI